MNAAADGAAAHRERRRAFALAAAIVALGFLLRVFYALWAQVEHPVRGDITTYVSYAWNLVHQGVYSGVLPQSESFPPDSYRGPGYPLLLAAAMLVDDANFAWLRIAIGFQIVLGTATIALSMAYARHFLSRNATLAVGLLVAVWPHLVVFCSTLLAETLFGFCVLLALTLLARAGRARPALHATLAGLTFGYATLVNPLLMLFPPALAAGYAWRRQWRIALPLLAAFLVLPAGWALRNASVGGPGASQRMLENLVQGSWPQFLPAFNTKDSDEISRRIVDAVTEEQNLMAKDPLDGFATIAERMGQDPGYYVRWYALFKPWSLWDWSVTIGAGDIYFLDTARSPYMTLPLFRGMEAVLKALNPLLAALALLAAFYAAVVCTFDRRECPVELRLLAWFAIYVTAVHTALQAEPRFAVSYRPEQVLLAVTAALAIVRWIARLRQARQAERA